MYDVTFYLCEDSIWPVLSNIPKQLKQSCTPLVNKQFSTGFHSDLMTDWRHIKKQEQFMQMRYNIKHYETFLRRYKHLTSGLN